MILAHPTMYFLGTKDFSIHIYDNKSINSLLTNKATLQWDAVTWFFRLSKKTKLVAIG